jgi:hypothetical protein
MAAKLYTSDVWLRKRYVVDKKTPEQIAKEKNSHTGRFLKKELS